MSSVSTINNVLYYGVSVLATVLCIVCVDDGKGRGKKERKKGATPTPCVFSAIFELTGVRCHQRKLSFLNGGVNSQVFLLFTLIAFYYVGSSSVDSKDMYEKLQVLKFQWV